MDFKQIKLVIWDLDDTFWKGILTEGGVEPVKDNIKLIKILTDNGIVNSICSKNDEKPVVERLTEMGVNDLFVFKSIDWTPKGPRISAMLQDMGLRAVNVLFIDDNIVNLNEAKHYEEGLMTAEPSLIQDLLRYFSVEKPKDIKHSRLHNYQVLERKLENRKRYSDNVSFLFASNTQVEIKHNCLENICRIHELILRTNQLNFTKVRSSIEDLAALLSDETVEAGYVNVSDKFGDYGTIGFYAMKNNKLIHFLFSCRTIGQGVEQYVYAKLGYPELETVGEVINNVTSDSAPAWINQYLKDEAPNDKKLLKGKIIFKGPCDMQGITSYLDTKDTINEMTYISRTRHNNMEHQGAMVNINLIPTLSDEDISYLVSNLPFVDEEMLHTALFDKDVDIIFLSTLQEMHFGIYKHKTKGFEIAFGEWNHPLTELGEWPGYINETVWTSGNHFTKEFLQKFSEEWIFMGRQTCNQYIGRLQRFMSNISPSAKVCLFLGSEMPYEGKTTEAWKDRHIIHRELNSKIREFAKDYPQIHIIDYTNYITSTNDYTDSIDHMQRYVQFKVAIDANRYIEEVLGKSLGLSGKKKIIINRLVDFLTRIHIAILNLRK